MQIRNPHWDDQEKTQILCEILPDDGPLAGQWVPFRAMQNDPVEYGRTLFEALYNGEYGAIADKVITQ